MNTLVYTHTIRINGRTHNTAARPLDSRVYVEGRTYGACIVATATAKSFELASKELAAVDSRLGELKNDLCKALSEAGLMSEADLKTRKGTDYRMGLVPTIQGLGAQIRRLEQESLRIRKVFAQVGDQVVVIWKSTPQAAESDLASCKGRVANYVKQGYSLEVRTDIEVTSKPRQSVKVRSAS